MNNIIEYIQQRKLLVKGTTSMLLYAFDGDFWKLPNQILHENTQCPECGYIDKVIKKQFTRYPEHLPESNNIGIYCAKCGRLLSGTPATFKPPQDIWGTPEEPPRDSKLYEDGGEFWYIPNYIVESEANCPNCGNLTQVEKEEFTRYPEKLPESNNICYYCPKCGELLFEETSDYKHPFEEDVMWPPEESTEDKISYDGEWFDRGFFTGDTDIP